MARVQIGSKCYTELEIVQMVNNLKKQNTELRESNKELKAKCDWLCESRDNWKDKHETLKQRVINLTKGF